MYATMSFHFGDLTIELLHYLHPVLVLYSNHHNSTWEAQKDVQQALKLSANCTIGNKLKCENNSNSNKKNVQQERIPYP